MRFKKGHIIRRKGRDCRWFVCLNCSTPHMQRVFDKNKRFFIDRRG